MEKLTSANTWTAYLTAVTKFFFFKYTFLKTSTKDHPLLQFVVIAQRNISSRKKYICSFKNSDPHPIEQIYTKFTSIAALWAGELKIQLFVIHY